MVQITPEFWNILQAAGGNPSRLKSILSTKSDEEVVRFRREFHQGLINLNHWKIWGAGYVLADGMSDDGFRYFRSWILGKGREAYETALSSPDDLGRFAAGTTEFENEALEYVASEVLDERDLEDPREDFEQSPDDEPQGEPFDEDEVHALYPKLAGRSGQASAAPAGEQSLWDRLKGLFGGN